MDDIWDWHAGHMSKTIAAFRTNREFPAGGHYSRLDCGNALFRPGRSARCAGTRPSRHQAEWPAGTHLAHSAAHSLNTIQIVSSVTSGRTNAAGTATSRTCRHL
ncbi:hypothetical protein ARGLB_073_00480 [Arthrobacter globiformis NBRC 12137]|uniref:Uncharacterized protein n=1 Tax=Arthrobacter globiformis (strain ATCC 8010 / DSM 20124 / JCM 1332 / NBRC 12137 / NCIMB 8907 / NRRL B-2979 / 168) TaxID=1077972 RepID=H0QNX8_ARTG1|nr:hypothetical protein ARGLB_073_00480 [Arthrobacter globiformis NBRC 12137]